MGHDHRDGNLLVGAHDTDAARQRMVEAALGEEPQDMQRLVLGRGSDIAVHS